MFCTLFFLIPDSGKALAGIFYVPGTFKTIQDAVGKVDSGDTILVAPGTYRLYFDNLTIHDSIVLKAVQGVAHTKIIGKSGCPVITFAGKSKAVIEGFTITSEHIDGRISLSGGGVYCAPGTSPLIAGNAIVGNRAAFGGAIYCDVQSSPTIKDNFIYDNKALVAGGGLFSFRSSSTILRNRFRKNQAQNSGGALSCNRDSSLVRNNIIWKNKALFGGGISCDRAASSIENNTLVGNSAEFGAGIMVDRGSVRLTNLILWQNSNQDLFMKETGSSSRPVFSDIGDASYRGINGNIAKDPDFLDPIRGDFRLQPKSPCRNTGMFTTFYMDSDGSANDMGAYGGPDALDIKTVNNQ